ncbi:hypothetical protein RHGRI_018223 [Rhododendron griersonianum]|uniref:Cytochrome P450 n=1 Tax=Rhododendron griersonianum TaxID=479676 RepID=A0AAV6K0U7_9ERIC|nr:hypothetical protein RHGRI_018223 [Rhododendron griersonianum]
MEATVSSILLSLALATFLTCAWKAVNWVWLRPRQLERCLRDQGFKGNPYRFLYGDYKEFASEIKEARSKPPMESSDNDIVPRVIPFHQYFVNLHGTNYFAWLGPKPRLNITDPKLIKEILSNIDVFRKPAMNPLGKLLLTGVVVHEGEKWATCRSLINPAFHLEKLKLMVPAMNSSCCEMISKWEVLVSTKGSCELDVWPDLCNLTAFLPTKANRRMKKLYNEVGALVRKIINKRQLTTNGEEGDNDLLGILLKSSLEATDQEQGRKNIKLTVEDIIEECRLFYLAGQETTTALLVWTMVLLSNHQKWQALAREEVLEVFGESEPNFDGLHQLKAVSISYIIKFVIVLILSTTFSLYSVWNRFP